MASGKDELVLFLRAQTGEFKAKMGEARSEVTKMGEQGKSNFSKFQTAGTVALLAVGAAAIEVGKKGLEMADQYETAHARLETAVKNSGGNFEELKGSIEKTDKTMVNLGFSSAETESSLARLTSVTHSAEKAQGLMTLTADIARAGNMSLADATTILVNAENGRFKGLNKLGVKTSDLKGRTDAVNVALQRTGVIVGGQSAAYMDTFAGKMQKLKTQVGEVELKIGLALIPAIEKLASIGVGAIEWAQGFNDALGGVPGKMALLTLAVGTGVLVISKLVQLGSTVASAVAQIITKVLGATAAETVNTVAVEANTVALAENTVAAEVNAGAHATGAEAAAASGVASVGARAGFLGVGAAALPVAAVLGTVALAYHNADKRTHGHAISMDGWKSTMLDGARTLPVVGTGVGILEDKLGFLSGGHKKSKKAADEHKDAEAKLKKGLDDEKAAADAEARKTAEAAQKHQEAVQVLKDHNKALDDLGAVAGDTSVKLAKSMRWSTDEIKAFTSEVTTMSGDVFKAFDITGQAVDEFKGQANVSFNKFSGYLLTNTAKTSQWATDIKTLADKGLNQGFIAKLLAAGPASEGIVKSILANVSKGAIDTINTMSVTQLRMAFQTKLQETAIMEQAARDFKNWVAGIKRNADAEAIRIRIWADTSQASQAIGGVVAQLRTIGTLDTGNVIVPVHVGPHARGGVIGAGEVGTVGEQGMELVQGLPGGGVRVMSNPQSRHLLGMLGIQGHASGGWVNDPTAMRASQRAGTPWIGSINSRSTLWDITKFLNQPFFRKKNWQNEPQWMIDLEGKAIDAAKRHDPLLRNLDKMAGAYGSHYVSGRDFSGNKGTFINKYGLAFNQELGRYQHRAELAAAWKAFHPAGHHAARAGGDYVTINVYAMKVDSDTGRMVADALQAYKRRNPGNFSRLVS